MPEKKKLKLSELKVKSFVTMDKDEASKIKGGTWTICKTCGPECDTEEVCSVVTCPTNEPSCDTCLTNCGTCETCESCGPSCPYSICKTCGPECTFPL